MKKQLTVALGLAVLATPAFATKARLQALGEDVYGSFYINDNRNIFYNAANVNNHKDLVTFEWGNTSNSTERQETPRPEGGLFKSHGNLVYGVHLGSESNSSNGFRQAAGVGVTGSGVVTVPQDEENNVDLFIGGDAGMKWGANITYSKSSDAGSNGDGKQEAIRSRLGVIAGDIEAYLNANIRNMAEDVNGNEFEGNLGYQVGAIYNFQDYRLFVDYRSFDGEGEGSFGGGDIDGDVKLKRLQVGAGRVTRLNDKASLFTKVQITDEKAENDTGLGSTFGATCNSTYQIGCEEYKATFVPAVIGLEYDALSWLVLRASVSQNLWSKEEDEDKKRVIAESTKVNAGATLRFGDYALDASVGTSDSGKANTPYTTVSMLYRF